MTTHYTSIQLHIFYNHIKIVSPSAVMLSSVAPLTRSASNPPAKRVTLKLHVHVPPPLTSLKDERFTEMPLDELVKTSQVMFEGLKFTSEEAGRV